MYHYLQKTNFNATYDGHMLLDPNKVETTENNAGIYTLQSFYRDTDKPENYTPHDPFVVIYQIACCCIVKGRGAPNF